MIQFVVNDMTCEHCAGSHNCRYQGSRARRCCDYWPNLTPYIGGRRARRWKSFGSWLRAVG